MNLLEKIRKISRIALQSDITSLDFNEICKVTNDVLGGNVYIIDVNGVIIGKNFSDDYGVFEINENGMEIFPVKYQKELLRVLDITDNLSEKALLSLFKDETSSSFKKVVIAPIYANFTRYATFIIARKNTKYNEEELVLIEHITTIIAIEMMNLRKEENDKLVRDEALVKMILETLSYSELKAIKVIFDELGSHSGYLVASNISKSSGITRSVIVNALKKLEGAGIIETRSLGMKGTHIKLLNEKFMQELNELV